MRAEQCLAEPSSRVSGTTSGPGGGPQSLQEERVPLTRMLATPPKRTRFTPILSPFAAGRVFGVD